MKIFIFLINLFFYNMAESQNQDTLVTNVSKLETSSSSFVYAMSIRNINNQPICILHSVFIDLNALSVQSIVPYSVNKTEEYFGLSYSAQDTTMILERTLYDGEMLMPNQVVNFKVSIPQTGKSKILYFEFIVFPDFCYMKLKEDMKKTATWYNNYKMSKVVIKLPN
jgi:hypothetical protein